MCLPRKEHTVPSTRLSLSHQFSPILSVQSGSRAYGPAPGFDRWPGVQLEFTSLLQNYWKICPLSTRVMSHTEVKLHLPGPILDITWAKPAWGQRQLKEPRANRERSWRHCLSSWSRPCLESPRFNLHEPVESPLCVKPCLCRRSRHRHVSSRQKMSW